MAQAGVSAGRFMKRKAASSMVKRLFPQRPQNPYFMNGSP
jgi:hypothetical protein